MRELPVVDDSRCIACGDCVPMCPANCLAMGQALPWLIRPAACTACSVCALICPTNAIALQPLPPA